MLLRPDRLERRLPEFPEDTRKALSALGFNLHPLNGIPFLDLPKYHSVPDLALPYQKLDSSDLVLHSGKGEVAISSDHRLFIPHDTFNLALRDQLDKLTELVAALRGENELKGIRPISLSHASWLDLTLGMKEEQRRDTFNRPLFIALLTRTLNGYAFGYYSRCSEEGAEEDQTRNPEFHFTPVDWRSKSPTLGLALVIAASNPRTGTSEN